MRAFVDHTLTVSAFGVLLFGSAMAPASAQEVFTPPTGCTAYVTIQARGCVVAHNYTCEQDMPGDQWDILFDMTGPFYQSRINDETQWVESITLPSGETDRLEPGAANPASFTELLATNRDDYEFSTVSDVGVVTHFKGRDTLTGTPVVIDGVPLEQTAFDITATDAQGGLIWRRRGNELIHRDWRMFFSDTEEFEDADGIKTVVGTPVEFIFPGEPGFLSTKPKYDCDSLLAQSQTPRSTEDATNDKL